MRRRKLDRSRCNLIFFFIKGARVVVILILLVVAHDVARKWNKCPLKELKAMKVSFRAGSNHRKIIH